MCRIHNPELNVVGQDQTTTKSGPKMKQIYVAKIQQSEDATKTSTQNVQHTDAQHNDSARSVVLWLDVGESQKRPGLPIVNTTFLLSSLFSLYPWGLLLKGRAKG